jgi:HPt (histidine-containing phosphotransfer) domain-containing protein
MILDKNAALERIEYDQELYDEICGIFREDVPAIIILLKVAFQAGDLSVATRHAHSIKSAAANIGASDLSEAARRAENSLRSGNIENIQALMTEIDASVSLVLDALE